MDYASLKTSVATLTAIDATNAEFLIAFADGITYAEQRIHREMDMMVANVADGTSSTVALNRTLALPTTFGTFQIVDAVNVITPASVSPESGTRIPLTPVSRSVLDLIYPSTTGAGVPEMFCYFTQSAEAGQPNLLVGPWPDDTYRVEVIGKIIPPTLSATNTTTFLTANLPELLLAGVMIHMTGYMQNWGAQADDPKMALSWSSQYDAIKASADTWEARKRFSGASWTSKQPEPTAVPQRG